MKNKATNGSDYNTSRAASRTGGCTQILLARIEKIGYKGKLLLNNTFNPFNLENAMKNEKINQNLDSN
ncbi:MAG: hypothetical protein IJG38_06050, partial [Thermoguttaceae bacterium]|nr:hypothetical protein [Thermoguttaceae bacterium]